MFYLNKSGYVSILSKTIWVFYDILFDLHHYDSFEILVAGPKKVFLQ
jgi:hypothetical protein